MNYWYLFIMTMTREDRRSLTIEAMTSTGRDERIAWAVHALDLGAAPTPSLCSLALFSVERISNPWEVDDLFRRSVDELGLARPAPEEYLRQHARDVAEGIVSGTVEPLEGAYILDAVADALRYRKIRCNGPASTKTCSSWWPRMGDPFTATGTTWSPTSNGKRA